MTDEELERLLSDLETYRVERKAAFTDRGKLEETVCAYANDLPNHGQQGILFIGATDKGECAHWPITDLLLLSLSDMRSTGNILPFPVLTVEKRHLRDGEMAVVMVEPSLVPPVRYNGRIWVRVGPSNRTATAEEERRLHEKRRFRDLPHDLQPVHHARERDLDRDLFRRVCLPNLLPPDILEENHRSDREQLISMKFLTNDDPPLPTVVGLLAIGQSPADFIPGAYVQFLRIEGVELSDPVADQKEIHGPLPELLRRLDEIMQANLRIATDIQRSATEMRSPDYPLVALQQLLRNAIMHRDYGTSNAPVRLTWFADRVEIQNPGGPYGQVTRHNFGHPGMTDYRNPSVAGIMKELGYVQRFGVGIALARKRLAENDNPEPEFSVEDNHLLVTVRRRA